MPTYRVTFEDGRIGPAHEHFANVVRADYLGDLAQAVYHIACEHIFGDVEVVIDQREEEPAPTGFVYAGFTTAARFHVEEIA